MSTFHLDYLLYLFLVAICFLLAFNSPSMEYVVPTTKDKFGILDYNIEYLSQIIVRLDRQLEIIYFIFLIALFFLGFCYGRTQRKMKKLEEELAECVKVVKTLGGGGRGCEMHPAYGNISMGLESTVRDLVRAEFDSRNEVPCAQASEKEIKEVRELQGKISVNQESTWRPFGRRSTLDVLAATRRIAALEAEVMRDQAARQHSDVNMAPPAYTHENKESTEKISKSGDA